MHRKVTKLLSLFLSAAMVMGSMSLPVLAEEGTAVYAEAAEEEAEEEAAEFSEEEDAAGAAEEAETDAEAFVEAPEESPAQSGTDEEAAGTEDASEAPEEEAAAPAADEEAPAEEAAEAAPAAEADHAPAEAEDAQEDGAEEAEETAEAAAEPVTDADAEAAEEVVSEAADAADPLTGEAYVLMNIPYDEFFAGEGVSGVDIVSTATVKTYNQTMAGGSYHAGYDAADPISGAQILGVTYPVYVADLSALAGMTAVTDADSATITVAAGKSSTTTKEVSGKDLLFASGSYAYYILSEAPANYKVLSGSNGSYSFSAVHSGAQSAQAGSAAITYGGHYTDLTLDVEAEEAADDNVTGVILTAGGSDYVLRHVENIWRKTSLGWNWGDLDGAGLSGKTITAITYYLQDGGVYRYSVDIPVKQQLSGVSAAFNGLEEVAVTGLPEDIQNPKATISSVVGRGETPVVIADGVAVDKGAVKAAEAAVAGTNYTIKVVSDNYADLSITAKATLKKDMKAVSIGGISYYYADTAGDDEEKTSYGFSVTTGRGDNAVTTAYSFEIADLTQVGGTSLYYTTAPNVTPLSGTLYGFGEGTATNYKEVYGKLGVGTSSDPAYDAVSSATGYTGHHAKDIPSLVTFGKDADGEKAITGLALDRAAKTVDAVTYVEASILQAEGKDLNADQQAALAVTLKTNPMTAPQSSEVRVKLANASLATSKYGVAEFAIVPDDTVEGYVWSEYWSNVYAATISDGKNTVGAVHWIDLYGEAATSGAHYNKIQIALNNGTSKASNQADVARYAAFFDGNYIKSGTYTITVYAEGYADLTAKVQVGMTLKNKTVTYNGKAASIDVPAPAGVEGEVVTTCYSDAACKKALAAFPKNAGTYYVKAVAADLVASNVATLKINRAAQTITAKAAASAITAGKTTRVTASGAKETTKYTYSSSNTAVATVSANGTVTGKKAGTATITVTTPQTTNYLKGTKTVKITVRQALKKPGNCRFTKWNNAKYNSCQITWNKVDGANGYQTVLSWTDGSHAATKTLKGNVLKQDCSVVVNHVSQFKVRAYRDTAAGREYGPWSNVSYITPSPTRLTVKNASSGANLKVNISWNPIYGCNGYNVFVTTNPNGTWYWNQSTSVKAGATSATITKYRGSKLKKNTRYYVRIVTRRKRNGVFCTVPMPTKSTYIGSFTIK